MAVYWPRKHVSSRQSPTHSLWTCSAATLNIRSEKANRNCGHSGNARAVRARISKRNCVETHSYLPICAGCKLSSRSEDGEIEQPAVNIASDCPSVPWRGRRRIRPVELGLSRSSRLRHFLSRTTAVTRASVEAEMGFRTSGAGLARSYARY